MDMRSTIKTDAQRDRTLVQIAGFRHALKGVDRGARRRSVAIRRNYEEVIRQLARGSRIRPVKVWNGDHSKAPSVRPSLRSSQRFGLQKGCHKRNWYGDSA